MTRRLLSFPLLIAAVIAPGCSDDEAPSHGSPKSSGVKGIPAEHVDTILTHFNKGVGLMDRFQPVKAVKEFEKVVGLAPDWITGRLNFGIALLNAQGDAYYAQAEKELKRVIEAAPKNPYAHFSLGMLLRHLTRFDEARTHFERVVEIDPDDPDAHYQLGYLSIDDDPKTAREHLEKTLAAAPHHESACYRMYGLLRQAGEREKSLELMRRFRALKKTKAGRVSGMKYGEMGRYANIVRAFDFPADREGVSDAVPTFADVASEVGLGRPAGGVKGWPGDNLEAIRDSGAAAFGPGLAVCDVDGDGSLDVFMTSVPGANGKPAGAVLYTNSGGQFTIVEDSGIDGRGAVGAYFGDYDRDGDPDLYLTCAGQNRLYQNQGGKRFSEVTAASGTAGGSALSVGASWADADHDGDLDLYVANFCPWPLAEGQGVGSPNNLWRNNGDGTFVDVAKEAGIDGGNTATMSVLYFDADADHDLDLYLINHRSPNRLFLNDRVGTYTPGGERYSLFEDDGPGFGALIGDVDQNGWEDLLLLRGPMPPRLFSQVSRGRFSEDEAFAGTVEAVGGALGGLLGDLDLDGDLDLLLLATRTTTGKVQSHILMNRGGGRFKKPVAMGGENEQVEARGAIAADFDGNGSLELLVARAAAAPHLLRTAPVASRHWLTVIPKAKPDDKTEAKTQPQWVHPGGVGVHVEVKTGAHLQVGSLSTSTGYLSSTPLRAHFGLGPYQKGDYVRLVWPDAVLQSELEVAGDRTWRVDKVLRKPSSCPVLFSWDGEHFAYVTDFLGVGGLGFFVSPGCYAPPDPTEDVRIPPELVAEKNGRYLLRVAEPLEEVTYLDKLELRVYDHPAGVEIYPDERFAESEPMPTGRPIAVAEKIFPVAACTDRESSVLDRLRKIDRRCVEPPKDPRFIGYAREHWLELDFGDRLKTLSKDSKLQMCFHGWVEYTYSHVNYAAYQAGLEMKSPSIEVPDGRGGWRTVLPTMGFPAGLPRMMTLDVSQLPIRESGKLRIRSTMEIFWDQIFLAEEAAHPGIVRHVLQPEVAELRHLGYPREYSPDGSDPTQYDYRRIDPGVGFKNLTGYYTRFGDVRPLLRAADDRFVIMGKGEEVVLEFDASKLPQLKKGRRRTLVLHSDGYCKDMDLYTAFPDTVEPLPWHGMKNYPPAEENPRAKELREYRRTWNSRRVGGRW
jgi:FG-GAP-like repeat/ASPIC and UnbV/Tetratricopeptide repeat